MKTRCNKCRKLIDFGERYCPECKSSFIKENKKGLKDKEAEKLIKSTTWRKVRQKALLRDKCCVLCLKRGIGTYKRLQVHHIVKRTDDLTRAYDLTNLVTVCPPCHEELEKLSPEQQLKLLDYKPKEVDFFL